MKLYPKQIKRFWNKKDGWPAIVAAHQWSKDEAETQRRALLNRAGFTSLTLVDPLKGFDRVLEQLAILRSDLSGTVQAATMATTRLHYSIRSLADDAYWQKIALDRFHTTDLDALTEEQLTQLRNTLAARKSRKPKPALAGDPF